VATAVRLVWRNSESVRVRRGEGGVTGGRLPWAMQGCQAPGYRVPDADAQPIVRWTQVEEMLADSKALTSPRRVACGDPALSQRARETFSDRHL